jgi:hypothetical protein
MALLLMIFWPTLHTNRDGIFFRAPSEFYTLKEVSFYLGLSPIGLQAWKLNAGHVDEGNRLSLSQQQRSDMSGHQEVRSQEIPEQIKNQQLKKLLKEQAIKFIADMTRLRSEFGVRLPQSEIEECLKAVFGSDQLLEDLGGLEELLSEVDTYQVADSKGHRLMGQTRGNLDLSLQERIFGQIRNFDSFRGRGYISVFGELSSDRRFRTEDILMGDRRKVSQWAIVEFIPETPVEYLLHVISGYSMI